MTIKMFKIYLYQSTKIEEVEVEKETDKFVIIKRKDWEGKDRFDREIKRSNYGNYFNTFEEAKGFIINKTEERINSIKKELHKQESLLGELKELNKG